MPTKAKETVGRRKQRRTEALAARMPEELFERILGYMGTWGDECLAWYGNKMLGLVAVVSKYWARQCQAKIFRKIELRSAKDVRDLLAILDQPGTNIAQYVQEIALPCMEHRAPYWHLIPLLYAKLPLLKHHAVEVSRSSDSLPTTRTLRTIHPYLPRTVPSHNTRLHKLQLFGIHFSCFGDLVHLLDALRDLRILYCVDLSWTKGPPLTGLRRATPRAACIDKIGFSGTLDEYTLWLLSIYRAPPNTLRLNTADNSVSTTLRAFSITMHQSNPGEYQWNAQRTSEHTALWPKYSPYLIWPSTCVTTGLFTVFSTAIHPPVIALDLSADTLDFDTALRGDWPSFDTLLSTLPGVRKVVFGFRTSDQVSRFIQEVLEISMTHLRTKLEYHCAIFHHKDQGWEAYTPKGFFVSADSREAASMRPKLLIDF